MGKTLVYRDRPVFGFDIGHSSIKIMQIDTVGKKEIVSGYGSITFNPKSVKNGVIVNPEDLAKSTYELISKSLIGSITTKRVAAAVPVAYTYNRIASLPPLEKKDLENAIQLEAEQYIPVPLDQLYLDYEIVKTKKDGSTEVLMVAAPKNIVDSYMQLFALLDLEVAILETTIHSVARIVKHADQTGAPTLIIDFGSVSSDLAVYDEAIRVTGTTDWGGETLTKQISKELKITPKQAYTVKTRYGLNKSKRQKEIIKVLNPVFKRLLSEIRKMIRFYEERASKNKTVEQIIILGGGANLPGMSTHLTDQLRISTRLLDPWQHIDFGGLQPPHKLESTIFTTAAGLALINKEREQL